MEAVKRYILYQVYGDKRNYTQVEFSLLSFLPFIMASGGNFRAVIYCDQPSYFEKYREYADIHELTPERLQDWMGTYQFIHRAKIFLINDFFKHYEGRLLYLDGDTYCMKSPERLFEYIDDKEAVMHVNEGRINTQSNPIFRKLYKYFKDSQVVHLEDETTIALSGSLQMWNAGVIGMTHSQARHLPKVRMLTDALYADYPKHVMEQVAFSHVFQTTFILRPAADYVYHYWDRRETMLPVLEAFLNESKGKALSEIAGLAFKLQPIPPLPEKKSFFQRLLGK